VEGKRKEDDIKVKGKNKKTALGYWQWVLGYG
jgi:hypothetical protein